MRDRTKHPAYRALADKWRSCSFRRAPFIFPDDKVLLDKACEDHVRTIRKFRNYVRDDSFGIKPDKKLHLGLLPGPYSGNLAKARIFILLLNPGLSPLDYYAEQKRSVRTAIIADIRQKKGRYPFPSLDPNFSWLGGARYWRPRLDDHVRQLQKVNGGDYRKALAQLSKSICILQLVPYHSPAFGLPGRIVDQLGSTKAVRKFVHEVILPEAKQNRALVIVTRKAKKWGLRKSKNVVVYQGPESRGGFISFGSRGGKAMRRFLRDIREENR
jgi:hypothetical protein